MGLAERRRALGYSQEELAQLLGVDRTTVGRWENGRVYPQPSQRRGLATALEVSLEELEVLLAPPLSAVRGTVRHEASEPPNAGAFDEMMRRAFLRILTVSGALTALPPGEADALTAGLRAGAADDFARMNSHLWQVYRLSRSKGALYPVVLDQLATLNDALTHQSRCGRPMLEAAADLLQLVGEVAFDGNRYADASASYALAASVGKDAQAYDLWACALVRHAYVDMSEGHYRQAAQVLGAAERLAARGDGALSTRHWVASVQAEAYAALGDLDACERAMDRAETVRDLTGSGAHGGWLRFDGARLAEERGARYVRLDRLDLAEAVLERALRQPALAPGHSYRRRCAVLTDLAVVGAKRRDVDQVLTYGDEAINLARASGSGYVVRRLRALYDESGPLSRDQRVAELGARIAALSTS
ncbi:helix-turn-helix transcriptional regulator [Streptomyces californicus]|uniref:helix-turn-helix transcriptional regulator n=1 Tax=Streptomyces californicus TaxID=67351 RepID=UPI00296FD3A6|nr:helix-turn-helix transcriptional regulator [Streptomyces californicus]MDW4900254.1 helix-turn-helix transcriptional regulator [Streptomyces californicus]